MLGIQDVNNSLISAVSQGELERARQLINSYGLSYSKHWAQGYVLLRVAVQKKHALVAKLLLRSGAKVNSKSSKEKPCDTPLHFAAKNGDMEIVEMIISKGADIDAANQYGTTALVIAIENNKIEVTELLLNHRADVNARDKYGGSPLHAAAKIGNLQIVQHLLKDGAYVNCAFFSTWKKGYTPLHFAVQGGGKEVVTMLLERGANVDVKGEDGITPLHIAAKGGYVSIAEDLLNHGACIHSLTLKEGYAPLHFASEVGNEETVKLFMNRCADINATTKCNLTPLHIATKKGHKMVVQLLLQRGAEVDNQDNDGKTILNLAVEQGCTIITEAILKYCPDINNQSNRSSLETAVLRYGKESKKIVEALLEYGLNVNPEDANNPKLLHAAVEKGYLKIVEDLLKYGSDVNTSHNATIKRGFTPLHRAAKHKQEEVAELLISYEADINAQDETEKTPIFYAIESADLQITKLLLPNVKANHELLNLAVEKGCIEIVEALLQHGADVNVIDKYGRTALHYTALSECEYSEHAYINVRGDIAKLLISKGANVDAQTKNGQTAFRYAAKKGYVELVNVLLECGAKVDSKIKGDSTPLHLAAGNGYEEIVETILKFGADVNSRDEHGRTALHIASKEGHLKVVATLLDYGSDINITSGNNCTPLELTMDKIRSFDLNMDEIRSVYSQPMNSAFYDSEGEYYVVNRGVCSCHVTAKALIRHIVKMKTVNLYVSEKNLLSVSSSDEMSHFLCECEEEVASMKSEKINNAIVSFYDILANGASSLALFMRNENIVQALKANDYKTKFPIYASVIESNFRKGMERKELLEECSKILPFLFNNLSDLPRVCAENIFSYLRNEDLKILIDACKPLCIST